MKNKKSETKTTQKICVDCKRKATCPIAISRRSYVGGCGLYEKEVAPGENRVKK